MTETACNQSPNFLLMGTEVIKSLSQLFLSKNLAPYLWCCVCFVRKIIWKQLGTPPLRCGALIKAAMAMRGVIRQRAASSLESKVVDAALGSSHGKSAGRKVNLFYVDWYFSLSHGQQHMSSFTRDIGKWCRGSFKQIY